MYIFSGECRQSAKSKHLILLKQTPFGTNERTNGWFGGAANRWAPYCYNGNVEDDDSWLQYQADHLLFATIDPTTSLAAKDPELSRAFLIFFAGQQRSIDCKKNLFWSVLRWRNGILNNSVYWHRSRGVSWQTPYKQADKVSQSSSIGLHCHTGTDVIMCLPINVSIIALAKQKYRSTLCRC